MTNPEIINALKALLLPRLIEEKMLILLRQGKISKWFSGIGQEAISVGSTLAMDKDEFILPMHRNLGVFTTRDVDLFQLFCQFQGKKEGFTKGRDRSFHFGTMKHKVVGMISHLGPQLGIACGVALAEKIEKTNRSVLVFSGDGGASEGDFHEALNVASVWQLPVIFVIENNQWGLSTPSKEQFNCKQFIDKGIGYGMKTEQVDGNNILEVYDCIKKVKLSQSKKPEPFLVEALTFRMRGHEEASGTKYYPKGLQDKWKTKDPILKLETEILKKNILTENEIQESKKNIKEAINIAWLKAFETPKLKALYIELGGFLRCRSFTAKPSNNLSKSPLILESTNISSMSTSRLETSLRDSTLALLPISFSQQHIIDNLSKLTSKFLLFFLLLLDLYLSKKQFDNLILKDGLPNSHKS